MDLVDIYCSLSEDVDEIASALLEVSNISLEAGKSYPHQTSLFPDEFSSYLGNNLSTYFSAYKENLMSPYGARYFRNIGNNSDDLSGVKARVGDELLQNLYHHGLSKNLLTKVAPELAGDDVWFHGTRTKTPTFTSRYITVPHGEGSADPSSTRFNSYLGPHFASDIITPLDHFAGSSGSSIVGAKISLKPRHFGHELNLNAMLSRAADDTYDSRGGFSSHRRHIGDEAIGNLRRELVSRGEAPHYLNTIEGGSALIVPTLRAIHPVGVIDSSGIGDMRAIRTGMSANAKNNIRRMANIFGQSIVMGLDKSGVFKDALALHRKNQGLPNSPFAKLKALTMKPE